MQLVENLRRIWRRLVGGGGERQLAAAPERQSPKAEGAEVEPLLSEAVAPEPAEKVATEEAEETAVDDLTAIRGIGAATRERLNAAGIKSYAQLAGALPEEVRKALNEQGRNAKVEKWIRQARVQAAATASRLPTAPTPRGGT